MVLQRSGGSVRLCDLIDEYGDELEADFTAIYHLDLDDLWRGLLSPRRVLVLAGQLGTRPESAFRAAVLGGPQFAGWTREADLLADVYDALVDNSVITIKAAGGKTQRPDHYPRPAKPKPEAVEVPTIDDFPIHLVAAMTQK